jgi:hypothetical protein
MAPTAACDRRNAVRSCTRERCRGYSVCSCGGRAASASTAPSSRSLPRPLCLQAHGGIGRAMPWPRAAAAAPGTAALIDTRCEYQSRDETPGAAIAAPPARMQSAASCDRSRPRPCHSTAVHPGAATRRRQRPSNPALAGVVRAMTFQGQAPISYECQAGISYECQVGSHTSRRLGSHHGITIGSLWRATCRYNGWLERSATSTYSV